MGCRIEELVAFGALVLLGGAIKPEHRKRLLDEILRDPIWKEHWRQAVARGPGYRLYLRAPVADVPRLVYLARGQSPAWKDLVVDVGKFAHGLRRRLEELAHADPSWAEKNSLTVRAD